MTDQVVRVRTDDHYSRHHPTYIYEARANCPIYGEWPVDGSARDADIICQLHSNTRESLLMCDECIDMGALDPLILHRSYTASPFAFPKVWQDTDTLNLTTGRVETDPRKFAQHLADESKRHEDRTGFPADFQPADPSDTYLSDEGLDATHDAAVARGDKDSKGRFVWQV